MRVVHVWQQRMLFIVLFTWLGKSCMNHACAAATILLWICFFKLWMKDGSVLLYWLLDPLLLDDESEESVEHGWKSYLLLDDESDESAKYGWKSIRLGRYTKYINYMFLPALLIDLSSSDDKLKNNEKKLASSATIYGSSSLQRSLAQILLCD